MHTCSNCGKEFKLGYTGIVSENGFSCDGCAGIQRDKDGYFGYQKKKSIYMPLLMGKQK